MRLEYVDDAVTSTNYGIDIDDQSSGNYTYDAIGNLISDASEEIEEITWTVYGKIQTITRTSGSIKPSLQFEYSPDGHRSAKHVIDPSSGYTTSTWYTRDASGNIMATYEKSTYQELDTSELDLSTVVNILIADNGASMNASFMVSSTGLNLPALLGPSDYSTFKTYLATNSLLQNTLEAINPLNILNFDATLTTAVIDLSTSSDFYYAMTAYYGDATNYAITLSGGPCYLTMTRDMVSTNYFNFTEYILNAANPTDIQTLWDMYYFPTPLPLTMTQVALDLNSFASPLLYDQIVALVGTDIFMHYDAYLGSGSLESYMLAMTDLKSCSKIAIGESTCVQIMTLYDQSNVWALM